jgi:hypothetical protein
MRYYYDGSAGDDEDDDGRADAPDAETLDEDDSDAPRDTGDDDGVDEDDDLEADFPRGDGTADTSAVAYCPYCGELNELAVDPGGGSPQSYVEDCHVCCRPWRVTVTFDREGQAAAHLEAADE